ncbi:MAG: hypothetical protein ABEJ04_06310 [Halobacteriaceae archaeon]
MSGRPRTRALVRELGVRRQAAKGYGLGVALAVALFVFFVVLPDVSRSPALYVALAFVVAFAAGSLFTVGFVLVAAYRFVRRTSPPDENL